jgi:membrane protein required for colicin V production
LSWLDIVILVIISIAALLGLRIGIIKAVLSLAGGIIGVVLAGRFYLPLADLLTFIPQYTVAKIVAFAIILVGVMIIAAVLASLLKWAASLVMLGWVNRLGGAAFGLILGATLCGAVLSAWVKFLGIGEATANSGLALILLNYFPAVLSLLPEEFDAIRSFFQ